MYWTILADKWVKRSGLKDSGKEVKLKITIIFSFLISFCTV